MPAKAAVAGPLTPWTPAVVAKRLGVTEKTLANWRCEGSGPPFFKAGGRVLYRPVSVDAWEASREHNGLLASLRSEAARKTAKQVA